MKYSVIINCYNTLPLIKTCIEAALETTDQKTEILLINNHPPYEDAIDFIETLHYPRIRVLDPGKNIGCMPGFQYGAEHASGDYIVKLDDDVIAPKNNWIEAMHHALKDFPKLAYVALKPAVINLGQNEPIIKKNYTLEFYNETILFWCMMIKRNLWKSHFVMTRLPLYGVGERYYTRKAHELGLKKAYLTSHVCTSLGRTKKSDPLYGAWKLFYVKLKDQRLEYPEWKKIFKLGEKEVKIMKDFGYPDNQIEEIKELLAKVQAEAENPKDELLN